MWMSQSGNTESKLYYDIKNHILLYPLFSFLCKCHNLLTQNVSYTMISKTISYCILFSLSYVNVTICSTECKLYYDIKNHILLYPLFSFLCGYHNLLTQWVSYTKNYILLYPLFSFLCGCHNLVTQRVSYTMISKTISYCILFSLFYVNVTISSHRM